MRLALPIVLENLISSSLNFLDVLMIGQLGETSVAAVGLANQITFLMAFILFGTGSGMSVFSAQFWGKGDVTSIRKVLGICLIICCGGALFFTLIAVLIPGIALSFYTPDLAVIAAGSGYLRITGFSYLFMAITFGTAATLRSMEHVKLPVVASATALGLKTLLNYLLIFGRLGLPEMGIEGAALATVISRILECGLLIGLMIYTRNPLIQRLEEIFSFSRTFFKDVLNTALPVVINEGLWSLGISIYNAIYARISTEAVAAMNIAGTIESLAFVLFIGVVDATAIMVGNQIGAGKEETAFTYGKRVIVLGIGLAWLVGGTMVLLSGQILSLYNISADAHEYVRLIIMIMAGSLWVRVTNMNMIVGIFRSGGDTRFALALDGGAVWVVGIPLALLGAFVFKYPVYWVYLMVMGEEVTKFFIGLYRFFSKKWINNLVGA